MSNSNDFRVLILAPFGKDGPLIESVLRESGFAASSVENSGELSAGIRNGAGTAIVTEEALQVQAIAEIADALAHQAAWSDLPIIVLTGGGTSTPVTESAVRSRAPLGNVALLERPLRPATLVSSVATALSARQRQYEIRDYLRERKQAEETLQRAHDALETLVEQRTAALHRLSTRLLRVQDEERRRIARELHDSLGQYLTAAKINLDMLAREDHPRKNQLREARQLIERAISDTRTLSHLLHPPLLDEAGFVSAARWYVEGFGKRSGISAVLDIPSDLQRLAPEVETALFRVLQESLTNVHRHSRSPSVEVRLTKDETTILLTIQDHGRGIPRDALERFRQNGTNVGVGLAGMRERLKELGGALHLDSGPSGTTLKAMIPVATSANKRSRGNSASISRSSAGSPVPPKDSAIPDQQPQKNSVARNPQFNVVSA